MCVGNIGPWTILSTIPHLYFKQVMKNDNTISVTALFNLLACINLSSSNSE